MFDDLMTFYERMATKFRDKGYRVGYISIDPGRGTAWFLVGTPNPLISSVDWNVRHTLVKLRPGLTMPDCVAGYYFSADAEQMVPTSAESAPPEWAEFYVTRDVV